jgi:hypothetical protein
MSCSICFDGFTLRIRLLGNRIVVGFSCGQEDGKLRHATIALRWGPGLPPRPAPGKHDVAYNVDGAAR